ncbi:hypothetical protein DGG96_18950 [Legionella qingyii]|uniref:Uncharacterized protein n=1 Tax=Legionella qingyii TaxID=2184757 RepID=A0A317TYG4_9GAMM|nr:hypothetical protein DGG96_18950 [Legionella qingyii]
MVVEVIFLVQSWGTMTGFVGRGKRFVFVIARGPELSEIFGATWVQVNSKLSIKLLIKTD